MKFKKLLLTFLSVLLMFLLVSCDETVKIKYTDKNGNQVEFTLEETSDAQTLKHVANYISTVDYLNTTFEATADLEATIQTNNNKFVSKAQGKASKNKDYLKANGFFEVKGYSTISGTDKLTTTTKEEGSVFGDFKEKAFYADYKFRGVDYKRKFTVPTLDLPEFDLDFKHIKSAKIKNVSITNFTLELTVDPEVAAQGPITLPDGQTAKPFVVDVKIENKSGRIVDITMNYDFTYEDKFGTLTFKNHYLIKANITIQYKDNLVITPLTKEQKALYL